MQRPDSTTIPPPRTDTRCCCGRPGDIYADDDRTPLCGRCWLAIYLPEARDDDR